MNPLICPNCRENMTLDEKNIILDGDKYDKWLCHDCIHIIVLDYRGNKND